MNKLARYALPLTIAITILASGCSKSSCESAATGCKGMKTPTLGFDLSGKYASPDGMTIGPDGSIYLAINNAGKGMAFENNGLICKITKDDKLEEVCKLPPHPVTKKVSPLGITFDKDGNLYVSDNQAFTGGKNQSRLLRVNMKDGKPGEIETLAEGFMMSNGIEINGDYIYVNETNLDPEPNPMLSCVYRFKLSDLSGEKPIKVTGLEDPNLFLKVETKYTDDLMKVGANGITFDSKGTMYICNFGEASILKVEIKEDGSAGAVTTLCKGNELKSTDGLHIDQDDNLWVADFIGNAVARIETKTGKVCIVAKNEPGDGKDGALDAPSECIRRGDKLYVANIDLDYGPNAADALQTISVIDIKGCGSGNCK